MDDNRTLDVPDGDDWTRLPVHSNNNIVLLHSVAITHQQCRGALTVMIMVAFLLSAIAVFAISLVATHCQAQLNGTLKWVGLGAPTDMFITSAGNIVILDYEFPRLVTFAPDSSFIGSINFTYVNFIAASASGAYYNGVNSATGRTYKFTTDGQSRPHQ